LVVDVPCYGYFSYLDQSLVLVVEHVDFVVVGEERRDKTVVDDCRVDGSDQSPVA
jgi:hypothetical protein